MTFSAGVGFSTHDDVVQAIKAAAAQAGEQCPKPAMVLAFVTHAHPGERLAEAAAALQEAFPGVPTAGGEVNGLTYEEDRCDAVFANRRAVAVVAFGGDGIRGSVALSTELDEPRQAGRTLAQRVLGELGAPPVGGIFLGAGISRLPPVDQQVLDGIRDAAPRLRMTGTGLCGGMQVDGTYDPGRAFLGGEVVPQGLVLAVIGGDVRLGFSAANGMKPVGAGAFVTKVEGPEILELNGRPAKEVVLDLLAGTEETEIREMFGRNPQVMSIERGITLAAPDPEGDFYWCHFAGMFTERDGMFDVFSPKLGMGLAVVRIDPESCMGAVADAAAMLQQDAGSTDFELTLAFSCSLRGFTLGPEVAREDNELRKHLHTRRHLGIVANGEVGCYRQGRPLFTGWVYALWGAAAR